RDLLPRLSGDEDYPYLLCDDLRRHQPVRRPALHGHRPPDPLRMSRLLRQPMIVAGGVLLVAVIVASAAAPWLVAADPIKPVFGQRLQPPRGLGGAAGHPLGTDNLGRDILARLLYGGRISLVLAASAVALAAGAGVVIGLAAGLVGGRLDALVMRLADVQLAFSVIMHAIAIVAGGGTSPPALLSVLAPSRWVLHPRTVRGGVRTTRLLGSRRAARP